MASKVRFSRDDYIYVRRKVQAECEDVPRVRFTGDLDGGVYRWSISIGEGCDVDRTIGLVQLDLYEEKDVRYFEVMVYIVDEAACMTMTFFDLEEAVEQCIEWYREYADLQDG